MELGIKGHETRDKEVIELLKMLGGRIDVEDLPFDNDNFVFYIEDNKCVYPSTVSSFKGIIYSLEEFEDKFLYKVGDKVKTIHGKIGVIKQLVWNNKDNAVRYELEDDIDSFYFTIELQLYKEETITIDDFKANTKEWLIDKLESMSKDNALQTICDIYDELHKPKYPKTYEKCCDVLLISPYYNLNYITYEHGHYKHATSNILLPLQNKLNTLGKLLICRDAYWKIVGEEMGLGKSWEPDWNDLNRKYFISLNYDGISLYNDFRNPQVLAFPTEEIRNVFYENFKDLIEKCKELL